MHLAGMQSRDERPYTSCAISTEKVATPSCRSFVEAGTSARGYSNCNAYHQVKPKVMKAVIR